MFAELPCEENMEYKDCGPAYERTCRDHLTGNNPVIPSVCVEDCFCIDGFVRDGEQCVLPNDCGCIHDGQYYSVSR